MILTVFLVFYRLLWVPLLPVALIYLWRRGRKDPDYTSHLAERFGFYASPLPQNALWFHAVSLGETRSAIGLIRLALARGDKVILTHFTPAGRRESLRQFGPEIASGQLAAIWVPFDMRWCYRRFFRACRPRIGLTLEVEIWPAMIFASKAAGIPLYMCNSIYGTHPFARDSRGLRLRQRVISGFAGAFVKSPLQAERFAAVGLKNITVTGELRFDQPVPAHLPEAAKALRAQLTKGRPVITIASGVEAEEDLYAQLCTDLFRDGEVLSPLVVYVPRAPERFGAVADGLRAAGLKVARRSATLDETLATTADLADVDILVGDSLGEMFFYLALADKVIVGGGFNPRGAHNIIEPLMMNKTVLTGPHTWTIEFPFVEAEAAGIATSLSGQDALLEALKSPTPDEPAKIADFLAQHQGASARTLAAIDEALTAENTIQNRQ